MKLFTPNPNPNFSFDNCTYNNFPYNGIIVRIRCCVWKRKTPSHCLLFKNACYCYCNFLTTLYMISWAVEKALIFMLNQPSSWPLDLISSTKLTKYCPFVSSSIYIILCPLRLPTHTKFIFLYVREIYLHLFPNREPNTKSHFSNNQSSPHRL